jgi:hypothetical protein
MKPLHLYEVKMLDGTRYQGEIAYQDEKKVVMRLPHKPASQKLRLFNHGILSIQEIGWKKAYALR